MKTENKISNIYDFEGDNYQNQALFLYYNEIKDIPVLTEGEEIELLKSAKEGDKEAIKKLTYHNLKFVVKIAEKYQGRGTETLDLIQAGNEGLINAIKYFDLESNYRFLTYARKSIESYIVAFITSNRNVVFPKKINHYIPILKRMVEDKKSIPEIILETGLNESIIRALIPMCLGTLSLEQTLPGDDASIQDFVKIEDDFVEKVEDNMLIEQLLELINEITISDFEFKYSEETLKLILEHGRLACYELKKAGDNFIQEKKEYILSHPFFVKYCDFLFEQGLNNCYHGAQHKNKTILFNRIKYKKLAEFLDYNFNFSNLYIEKEFKEKNESLFYNFQEGLQKNNISINNLLKKNKELVRINDMLNSDPIFRKQFGGIFNIYENHLLLLNLYKRLRNKDIFLKRKGINQEGRIYTLAELADMYSISGEAVRLKEIDFLSKLKEKASKSDILVKKAKKN